MPAVVPFVVAAASAAGAGASIYQGQKQATASKKAAGAAEAQNKEAIAQVKASQESASTKAVETIKRRTASLSQTVFTSPLGLPDTASLARKTLTGQ